MERQRKPAKNEIPEGMKEIRGQSLATTQRPGQGSVTNKLGMGGVGSSLPEIVIGTPKVNNVSSNLNNRQRADNEKRDSLQRQSLNQTSKKNELANQLLNATNSGSQFRNNQLSITTALQHGQILPTINNQVSPRREPANDYTSLGQRIQQQNQLSLTGRQNKNSSSQQPKSRGGLGSRGRGIMTPTNEEGALALVNIQNMPQHPQSTTFENYLKKVIKSVERRKKKPTSFALSGIQNQTQRVTNLGELEYATAPQSKGYGILALNSTSTYNNFSNQVVAQNSKSLQNQNAMIELAKQQNLALMNGETFKQTEVAILEDSRDQDTTQNAIEYRKQYESQSQNSMVGPKNAFNEPKASEQVAFLLREAQKKEKIFIPLERSTDVSSGYMYKEMKNAPDNHAGIVVFSKQGFVTVGKERNATSDFVSNEEFIQNGVNNYILKEIPFFKKFQAMRIFKQWKYIMRWNFYQRKRAKLAESFFFAKPIFSEKYSSLVSNINTIRTLPLMEIKQNIIYGKKQQQMLDEKCKSKLDQSKLDLDQVIRNLKEQLNKLKSEIQLDDSNFEKGVKEMRVQAMIKQKNNGEELVMFSKARRQKEQEDEQFKIQKLRHVMFDKFIEMILKFVSGNLIEVLFENKKKFREIFRDQKNGPQFEVSICFNQKGVLDTDPSMEDHHCSFLEIFESMEQAVYQNNSLIDFVAHLISLLFKQKEIYYKRIFKEMENILGFNEIHIKNNEQIFDNLKKDVEKCREYLEQFIQLQEIYDFAKDWESTKKEKQISSEMGFYKETWLLMDRYNSMIDKIPGGNLKLGTILVETQSLKKYLAELPKRVIDSIRHNVTLTMETETKSLREELSKTSEILDQLPTSLNVYVEQVNTLKNLPKLQKTAAEGLNQNKDTMEKIMQSSSLVLSKKIKAFEKKYVETYLQDKSRLEDCADTLEELFKRSKAIHEIRSKVILYKEFLKLLYEDDPRAQEKLKQNKLQCSDDYEFVQSLHKETIKLWKMMLYWKKRRQMCYNTPFLQLDTNKIIRSINKINKYFEDKLSKNEFIRDKSRNICKVVILQVKETSLIIEFLKDLRRESLQQRHWLQIFNLIKAPHLKNSNNFTIINLKEYHIQNYREEITAIIDHANTELKYEKVFKSIKEEWETLELKIIPYKETMDSYILINTDSLSNAIEENLTTLEAICQSKFANHVKLDIDDWVKTLRVMLRNLEIWVNAQKYWINLDPIFQSAQLEEILGQDAQQFQEHRNSFKRIMWSAFKNPKATYNLMINNRIEVFENLIKYFSVLQMKVHDYLEKRRLAFPRFFFLSDAQFLEFLTLANSNQDFNDYVNILFQGAQKLYINRIFKPKQESSKFDDLGSVSNKNNDEQFFNEGNESNKQSPTNKDRTPYLRNAAHRMEGIQEQSIDIDTLTHNESNFDVQSQITDKINNPDESFVVQDVGARLGQITQSQDSGYQVLGMISANKELFLFEKSVPMKEGVEKWLLQVELSMQETVAKQINYAVSSFPKQSLDEWILDYPQQVIITTIHLILSHEINELLEEMSSNKQDDGISNAGESDNESESGSDKSSQNDPKSKHISKRSNISSAGNNAFSKKSSKKTIDDDEDTAMREYLKKKNELKAQQLAEEEEEKKRKLEEIRLKLEANEVPKDVEKEKRKFIDDMFGKDFSVQSPQLIDTSSDKNEESKLEKSSRFILKKPEFKEIVMGLLQKKSFQGLYLRLQFWINQIVKSLYCRDKSKNIHQSIETQLNSLQKMVMKSIITFLLYQREIVDNFIKKNVTDQNDFEWQSQIRLLWTGVEPGCRVDCGGWSSYQQNEYLGSQSRLTITPLTNRYFIFISAALREKSAVLFKCAPSQQYAGEVFEEFANICSVPFKKFQCSSKVQMKIMMQHLNGAALASVWVFFEHLDKLPFIHLQTFNKEIQMVQQQFIIAELTSQDQGQIDIQKSRISNSNMSDNNILRASYTNGKIQSQLSIHESKNKTSKNKSSLKNQSQPDSFTKSAKVCFGVFGSISHSFIINHSDIANSILSQAQSAFRTMALTRPNEQQLLKFLLKSDGFDYYEDIALCSSSAINILQSKLESQNEQQLQVHEQLESRDLKTVAKLSSLIMSQDLEAYKVKQRQMTLSSYKVEYLGQQKTKEQKIKDIEIADQQEKENAEEKFLIEINAAKEGLRIVLKQKFINAWREIKILEQPNIEFHDIENVLDQSIDEAIKTSFKPLKIERNVNRKKANLSKEQKKILKNINNRKKSISNSDVIKKYTSCSGQQSLIHTKDKAELDQEFIEQITKTLKDIAGKLHYDKINQQLRSCIHLIEFMRRTRGIAFIGPVCSGKTTILKLVSNALSVAYKIKMRTSVVNSSTFTNEELYGTIDAFKSNSNDKNETSNNFNKGGIFQIIIDVFEKEKTQQTQIENDLLIQSIFFDSQSFDSTLTECLIDFLFKSNKREYQISQENEFLMDLAINQPKIQHGLMENIPVTLPNGNQVMFPSDLYLFFETTTLKDASPCFISKIGLVMTEEEDLSWQNINKRLSQIFLRRHKTLFTEQRLDSSRHFIDFQDDFLIPFIEKLTSTPKIQQWQYWKVKSSIIQFYNLLNSIFFRLNEVCKDKNSDDDNSAFMIKECEKDVFWSCGLLACIWSFGAPLNKEGRKVFEEQFFNFRRKFNINIGGPGRQRFTLFDIYYDLENLSWDLLQEKLEYKLKLQYNPMTNQLLIPSVEVSQSYFMMDIIMGSMRHEESLDKNFRILGPSATSKSTALHTFIKKYNDQYIGVVVPMSSYLTIDKLKEQVEKHYIPKRKNQLEPSDGTKRVLLLIDDLHIQSNLKVNVLEFIRTWCVSKGYYDIPKGFFKNIGAYGTIMAQNSEYRTTQCKYQGKKELDSRFLYYANTLYADEFDFEKYKIFIQHWLTSKMWSTSKIINKYYILMTNSVMVLFDKLKRQEFFHNSSFQRLTSFHFFARFCSNIVNYTLISDDPKEIVVQGQKEEDAAANMMIYELCRSIGDRILLPNHRTTFTQRLLDSCKQEFIAGSHLNLQYIDSMILGNYHQRRSGAHIKYQLMNNDMKKLREEISQKIRKSSNNHFLESFLDAPNGPKEIFRLSRLLFKEMQHAVLVGQAGCGKHEYLQLAAILNDALIFEFSVSKYGDPLKFAQVFKKAIISAVSLNTNSFFVLHDQQLKDPMYIDYAYNFIQNICNNETCVLMDEDFRSTLIDIEREIHNQQSMKKPSEPSQEILFLQTLRKIQKNVHIVFMMSDFQSYFEWVSLFPGLESKCEVIFLEELSSEGYRQLTQEFFNQRDTDNQILTDQKLIKSLVESRQITKHKILSLFYSQQMLQFTSNEDYMSTQAGEYVFNTDQKLHGFLFQDGNFNIQDIMHKQLNFNVPVEIGTLYKTRYIMFLELFRFLYDFLSMNLVIRRNYYETFLRKASEFSDFFKDIKTTKSSLHNESNQITYKLVSLRDKINKIQSIINDKDINIARRQKDINDLEIELKNNKDELHSVIYEKDQMIDQILDHLEKINGSEFQYIISQHNFKQHEISLLDIFSLVIEQDYKKCGYAKNQHDMYFLNREELINILNDRRNYDYDHECFSKIKEFINAYTINEYKDKPLFKQLFNYLMELYRKLNVRNTMANTFSRIKEIKEQIDSNYFSINYSKQFIDDKREEMEGLKNKFERIQDQEQSLSKRIEEAEISHMRTDHIFIQVEKYNNKIYGKLTEIKKRIETLLGDCIILAASVAFLGMFSFKERLQTRKEIYEYINNGCNIKCSPCWNETNPSLNGQNKIFKQVIKEYGLRKSIQYHNFSGIISQQVLVEALFTIIFAPSCPYIADPTGQLQEFMSSKLLANLKIKKLYASDQVINSKLEQVLRSSSFALLNDLNDHSSHNFGLCQDESLLSRLCTTTHNGFDFDYDRLQKLKQLHTLSAFHNSYNSVNKRVPTHTPEYENLSFYQVQIFTPRFEFMLNKEYMSKATIFVAMDDQEQTQSGSYISAPWVEIKEIMQKNFLPVEYRKIIAIKEKLKNIELKQSELNKNFENAFLVANQDTLQNINEYSQLKQSVEDIRHSQDEKRSYQKQLQNLLNEHNLLSSYSNVIAIMYHSLKRLSKISGEVTYSWKMYLSIIDQILLKLVKELHSGILQKNVNQEKSNASISLHGNNSQKFEKSNINEKASSLSIQQEFTIDEEFFSGTIIPSIYGTLISGIKQHLIPMFNLIFSVEISLKKKEISDSEREFFYKQLFLLKDFQKWRNTEHEFIDLDAKIEKTKFYAFKREILKIYPEQGRKIMENIEKELGQQFLYKNASLYLYGKAFQTNPEFKDYSLMKKLNIGFLCPDHEFKSKLCQLVYEQLSTVFQFNEEFVKLHHFIKAASWSHPIALFCQNQINLINTVCSIASYYGVGLEVVRTDIPQTDYDQEKKNTNQEETKLIKEHLIDYQNDNGLNINTYYQGINKDAAQSGFSDKDIKYKASSSACISKINLDQVKQKENIGIEDKSISSQMKQNDQNPLQLIEQCALSGSWVFISTLKFPSFWHKMCHILDQLRLQQRIHHNFRVFIDLQGYQQNEIPDSFIFDASISFYLTDQNNEDMEGFNDVWANILNDKILTELTQQQEQVKPVSSQQNEHQNANIEEETSNQQNDISPEKYLFEEEDKSRGQDRFIKSGKQRELYKDFLRHQKVEELKNNSNTLIFGSDVTEEIIDIKQTPEQQNIHNLDNINNLLQEIRSLGTESSKEFETLGNKQSYKNLQILDSSDQIRNSQIIERLHQKDELNVEEAKISRINSINQSIDISGGENALIQDLQSQIPKSQINTIISQKSFKRKLSIKSKDSLKSHQKSVLTSQKSLSQQSNQNAQQEVSQNSENKQMIISDIEANQAFEEFNNNNSNSDNNQTQREQNDTSGLIQ